MEIKWLRKALRNLETEAKYIAKDDPRVAEQVMGRIRQAVALLADDPAIGRAGRINGTRELIVPNTRYVMPYRVHGNRVEILRVFHASRKLPKRW